MKKVETTKKMGQYPKMSNCAPQDKMSNCVPQETVIKDVRLAAAYVPYENLCALFTPVEALKRGTAFPELYSPYEGKAKEACLMKWDGKERETYEE